MIKPHEDVQCGENSKSDQRTPPQANLACQGEGRFKEMQRDTMEGDYLPPDPHGFRDTFPSLRWCDVREDRFRFFQVGGNLPGHLWDITNGNHVLFHGDPRLEVKPERCPHHKPIHEV